MDIFAEIGLIVIFAGLGTYIARLLRQPLIPAYILSGVVLGSVLGIITDHTLITSLSEIGIAFLLFMVGLELHLKKLKDLGLISTVTGSVQMLVVFAIGYGVTKLIGYTNVEAIYLGVAVAFSSTMIVIKILSDKYETNTMHGRMTIGILVVQDIFAIIALSYLASADTTIGYLFFVKIALVLLFGILCAKFLFAKVFHFAARSHELLLITSLSVCFLFALLFHAVGLSITIGAFFAGALLANLPYNVEIVGKVRTLRDFCANFFNRSTVIIS